MAKKKTTNEEVNENVNEEAAEQETTLSAAEYEKLLKLRERNIVLLDVAQALSGKDEALREKILEII